jgi:hypothetical protein
VKTGVHQRQCGNQKKKKLYTDWLLGHYPLSSSYLNQTETKIRPTCIWRPQNILEGSKGTADWTNTTYRKYTKAVHVSGSSSNLWIHLDIHSWRVSWKIMTWPSLDYMGLLCFMLVLYKCLIYVILIGISYDPVQFRLHENAPFLFWYFTGVSFM